MKNDYIRIRISEIEKEKLKHEAEKRQMTMSEFILSLIRKEIS